jgi:hypothetical protein
MATHPTPSLPPVTEDAFLGDRQRMWASVCHAGIGSVIFLAIVLILMAAFLT